MYLKKTLCSPEHLKNHRVYQRAEMIELSDYVTYADLYKHFNYFKDEHKPYCDNYYDNIINFLNINNIQSVLDFGCVNSTCADKLIESRGIKYTGVCLSYDIYTKLNKTNKNHNINYVPLDRHKPIEVDLVLCMDVFNYLPHDISNYLLEMFDTISSNIIITYDCETRPRLNNIPVVLNKHKHRYTPVDLTGPPYQLQTVDLNWCDRVKCGDKLIKRTELMIKH